MNSVPSLGFQVHEANLTLSNLQVLILGKTGEAKLSEEARLNLLAEVPFLRAGLRGGTQSCGIEAVDAFAQHCKQILAPEEVGDDAA